MDDNEKQKLLFNEKKDDQNKQKKKKEKPESLKVPSKSPKTKQIQRSSLGSVAVIEKSRRDISYDDEKSRASGSSKISREQNEPGGFKYLDTSGRAIVVRANPRFKAYKEIFENMTNSYSIMTMHPIISVMITYDSTCAITVTKNNDREYWVKMYSM